MHQAGVVYEIVQQGTVLVLDCLHSRRITDLRRIFESLFHIWGQIRAPVRIRARLQGVTLGSSGAVTGSCAAPVAADAT